MKTAVILHGVSWLPDEGKPDLLPESQSHWLPWLKTMLEVEGFQAFLPDLPNAFHPVYQEWDRVVSNLAVDEQSLLIGHSAGGGFWLRWLAENEAKINHLVLVAPWINPFNDSQIEADFFYGALNNKITNLVKTVDILVSEDDSKEVLESVNPISKLLPNARVHWFENRGHFTFNDLGTREFPELLEVCLEN